MSKDGEKMKFRGFKKVRKIKNDLIGKSEEEYDILDLYVKMLENQKK